MKPEGIMQRFLDAVNRSEAAVPAPLEGQGPKLADRRTTDAMVLIADDDPYTRQALCDHLGGLGFKTVEAPTAATAYHAILEHRGRISALIADMIMPGGGAWELAQRARSIVPNLPVIFISGVLDQHVTLSAWQRPHTAFLQKPFELNDLTTALNALLSDPAAKKGKLNAEMAVQEAEKAG